MECRIQGTCMFQKMGDAMVILQSFGIVLLFFCQRTGGSPCLHLQVMLLVLFAKKSTEYWSTLVNFSFLLWSNICEALLKAAIRYATESGSNSFPRI